MIVDYSKTARQTGIDDKETLKMLFGEFFNVCQADINRLPEAISSSKFDDVKSLAHNIKGAARNLWLEEVGDAAEALEILGKNSSGGDMPATYGKLKEIYNIAKDEFVKLG